MRLDIGCGSIPVGDVNIDLFVGLGPHHKHAIKPKRIPKFVLSDAHFLPFRSKIFTEVHCSHVLEHLFNPCQALNEMSRVATESVFIMVPNNPVTKEHTEHYYSWSLTSFQNLLKRHFSKVEIYGRTKIGDVKSSRMFKLCDRLPILGKPMLRILSYLMALELHAVCNVSFK